MVITGMKRCPEGDEPLEAGHPANRHLKHKIRRFKAYEYFRFKVKYSAMRLFVNNQYCCFRKKDLPADPGDGKEPAETAKYRIICG